jgi:hypothetical protein
LVNLTKRKVKRLKLTKRTKMNQLPKMRYLPLSAEISCEMTKMPLGTKTTKNDSDAILKWIFNRELKQELIQTN